MPQLAVPARPLVVGAATTFVLTLAWAANDTRTLVDTHGTPMTPLPAREPTAPFTASAMPTPLKPEDVQRMAPLGTLALVALVLVVVAVVLVVLWELRRALSPSRRDVREAAADTGTPAVTLAATSATHHEELLAAGSPRNGIVACWHELERLVEAAGFPRLASETSTELTLRVLAGEGLATHTDAVAKLGGLYREARFSTHELTENHRARAAAALREVHAALAGPR